MGKQINPLAPNEESEIAKYLAKFSMLRLVSVSCPPQPHCFKLYKQFKARNMTSNVQWKNLPYRLNEFQIVVLEKCF